ncbi:MAG: rod shape-determining protein MreC [Anaerolineales bacterium]|nr:rod shape-determining protein MreC [Anaerolineales bacterium]
MNMPGNSIERVRWRLFIIFLIITLVLLFLHSSGYLSDIIGYLRTPFNFTQDWLSGRLSSIHSTITTTNDIKELQAENQDLRERVAELERQNEEMLEIYAEYTLLSALLDYARENPEYRREAADIIGWDTSNFSRSFVINKGENDGIQAGMPVETDRGLVGRVVSTYPRSAQVQLLTDPSSSINIRLGTSRADGVIEGRLNEPLRIKWIEQDIPIFENELVMTSGLGGNFPPDLIIGRVINVQQSASELFQVADVRPAVDFDSLEIVLVITDFEPISFDQDVEEE